MKIGEKKLTLRLSAQTEGRLMQSLGCSTAETAQLLRGAPQAQHVALAIAALAGDGAPPLSELRRAIVEKGIQDIAQEVADVLDKQRDAAAADMPDGEAGVNAGE